MQHKCPSDPETESDLPFERSKPRAGSLLAPDSDFAKVCLIPTLITQTKPHPETDSVDPPTSVHVSATDGPDPSRSGAGAPAACYAHTDLPPVGSTSTSSPPSNSLLFSSPSSDRTPHAQIPPPLARFRSGGRFPPHRTPRRATCRCWTPSSRAAAAAASAAPSGKCARGFSVSGVGGFLVELRLSVRFVRFRS